MRSVRRLIDDGLARQGAPGQEGKPHSGGASPCANSVQARSDELTSGLEIDAPGVRVLYQSLVSPPSAAGAPTRDGLLDAALNGRFDSHSESSRLWTRDPG